MEQYFFCLVDFGDNKLVVRSTEVRDFNPEHANDFEQDRKYDVLWQEQSGSFDGYFPAIIMCMAASLPELKQKARSVGVSRLPRSYELLLKEENHDSDGVISSDTSETKSKKKLSQDTRSSRRTRMMSTLGEVCKKTPKSAKASECDGQSLNSSERIQKNDFKSPAPVEQIQKSPTKYSKSPSKLEHIQKSPLVEKVSPFKVVKPSKLSTPKRSDTERYPCFSVTEQDESKLPPTLSPESRAKKMKLDDSLDSTLEYDDVTNILDHIDQGEDFQNNNNDDDENEEKNSKEVFKECDTQVNYSRSDFGSESGSEDATAKLYEDVERLKSELKEKNLQIISLRAGLRMSEEDRLQLREKNQTLEGTVTELREELEYTKTFQDDNKKLTRLVKTAGDLLVSGLQKFGGQMTAHSTPKTQVARDDVISHSVVKHLDFSALPNKSSKPSSPSPKKSKSHLPPMSSAKVSSKSSKRSCATKDDFNSPAKNAKKSESTVDSAEVPLKNPKKSESPSTSKKAPKEGLSHKEIVKISEAVRDDLSGNKSLEVDENKRICIGKHIRISQQKWSVIKSQPKISLFIKKLADSAYGRDALKVRVVGEPKGTSPKQQATPMKVDTFVAALRGRLLFEQPNHPNVDAAAAAARTLLATKMQDEARHKSKKE